MIEWLSVEYQYDYGNYLFSKYQCSYIYIFFLTACEPDNKAIRW
jgi:hypothetical protein